MLANILGPDGLIIIGVLVVLVFGGSAIPKLARSLGSAKTEFEKGLKDSKPPTAETTETTKTPDSNS